MAVCDPVGESPLLWCKTQFRVLPLARERERGSGHVTPSGGRSQVQEFGNFPGRNRFESPTG